MDTSCRNVCVCRSAVGIEFLDGVVYTVGGFDGLEVHSSVETHSPSTG